MTRILALSGSLRRGSLNTALARATPDLAPPGVQVEVATLHGIPLYDGDVEAAEGIPPAVLALRDRIVAADGLLLVSPEYNRSVPGVMKNAIDWLSRGDMAAIFAGRPVAVIGATPGPWGTLSAQTAWLPILKALGTLTYAGQSLLLARAGSAFDAQGQLTDTRAQELLQKLLAGFADFVSARPR